MFAAQEFTGKIDGDVDDKLHFAATKHLAGFGFIVRITNKLKIIAVLHRGDERARERAFVGGKNRGGKVLRIGVDRKAEEHELHQRDADHHAEGHAVALHLDKLLDDDRPKSMERKTVRAHEKLSLDSPMRPMKTSSKPDSILVHVC